ncbi:IclR family transcriptional regulator [Herbaspirillum sp. meg3]|uniref:IclR family transcriptional regulator n=1 Tax=Herbaspirillum rhizosphaerae TaxID=346179 RepID=A0ABW8ZES9_9BURK|nr:IclR family transcriptional regulator [Herbaspirillum sp. meg3]ASU38516.1 IclR family transcriptional regulator [Herbaspirillum sp. meg3]
MSYTVDAVSKAMELLFVVADHPGLGVTELAKRSGNTKARAFRLLGTLEESGLIKRKEPLATYSLGYRALFLGVAAQNQVQLSQLGQALLPAIGEACSESVLITIREGLETMCVAWWDSPHAIRVHSEMSARRPLYVGASSKLLLAYAPEEVQEAVLNEERKRYTPSTIVSRTQLKQAIKKILEVGYSVSYGEKSADTVALALPIRDAAGKVVAALSMTAPVSRMTEPRLQECLEILGKGAQRFSLELGYIPKS